jgi:hypothetical protein
MGDQRNPICAYECSTATEASDTGDSIPFDLYTFEHKCILLPVRYSDLLATFDHLYDLLYVVECGYVWDFKVSFQFVTLFADLVAFCLLLSCETSPKPGVAADEKIHFWIPSAWYHISWCLCSIWDRSSRVLPTFSRNHEHASYP